MSRCLPSGSEPSLYRVAVTVGVSHRMLTLTLRGLEHDGLVKRTVYATVPAKVEYELTDVGRSLIKPLSALSAWVQNNQPAIEAARALRSPESDTPTADAELPRPASRGRRRDGSSARARM